MRYLKPVLVSIFWLAVMQANESTADGESMVGLVSERIDVRIVNIDAVVSDRRGRPMEGLDRADFEVLIDGEPAEITHFAVGRIGDGIAADIAQDTAEISVQRPRGKGRAKLLLAIYIDNSNADASQRKEILHRLRQLLGAEVRPGDRVLVAWADRASMQLLHPFTDRLEEIERGLDTALATPTQDRRSVEFREILRDIEVSLTVSGASVQGRVASIEARIRAFAAEANRESARTAANLRRLVDALAGQPGHKALLYLGGGLSLHPGELLSSALGQALGRYATSLSGDEPSVKLPGGSFEDGSKELLALARHASVQGVTFYAAATGAAQATGADLSRSSSDGGAGTAAGQEENWAPAVSFSRRMDVGGSLELLAETTGGLARPDGQNLDSLLERLAGDRRGVYSLGVRPPNAADREAHRLEVRVRGRGRRVIHRRIYRIRDDDELAASRTLAALALHLPSPGETELRSGAVANPLGVQLEAGEARASDTDMYSVPLSVQVPVAALAVEAKGSTHEGQISIFFVSGEGILADGPVRQAVVPVTLANAEILDAMGRLLDYRLELTLPPGARTIAVGVRDDLDPRLSTQTLDLVIRESTTGPGS